MHAHNVLESVLRMFQVWACKQFLGIAHTNSTVNKWDKGVDPRCPSCQQALETADHVLLCTKADRVDIFLQKVDLLDRWLKGMDTEPSLRDCIVRFCRGRGYQRMT